MACSGGVVSAGGALVLALFEARGLANLVSKEVQLGSAGASTRIDLDLHDLGRVHWKRTLDTNTERDLADGERLPAACSMSTQDGALEDLYTLPAAFDDSVVNLDRVAYLKLRQVVTNLLLLYCLDGVHRDPSFVTYGCAFGARLVSIPRAVAGGKRYLYLLLQPTDTVQGPVDGKSATMDGRDGLRSDEATIATVGTVIPHKPDLTIRNGDRKRL